MVGFLVLGALLAKPPELAPKWACLHGLLQPTVYLLVPALLSALGLDSLGVRQLPGRNNASYFLCPVKTWERSAATYAQALLGKAPQGAVILADFNPGAVLKLVQRENGLRPDLQIEPTVVDNCLAQPEPAQCLGERVLRAQTAGRPVLLADRYGPYYYPDELARAGFLLAPWGPGLLVTPPLGREKGLGPKPGGLP